MATETKSIALSSESWTLLATGPANVVVRLDTAVMLAVELHIGQSTPDGNSPFFPMPADGFAMSDDAFVDGDFLYARTRDIPAGVVGTVSVIRTIVA